MYQLPHHDQYSSHHRHHQQQQQQPSAALHPFPPFYLFTDASSAATTEEQPAGHGSETTHHNNYTTGSSNLPRHKPTHREPAPAAKPSAAGGGGRSRKSGSKKAAAAGGPHGRKKTTEPLRGMGVEQLEHLRLQEAAAAAATSNQKKILLPKFKPAKKPVSRPAVLQQDPGTFPDEHYGVPVAAVISAERQRQLQLLYQAWVRRVTGAVGGGGQPSPYSGIGGAGRSSTATAGGGSELSSIPKIAAFNHNNNNPYDDLPTCDGPCCLEKKGFSTAATAMVRKNSGIVIREERFQETASDEAPLINSSSSSNYHRLPAGLMMNSVQNDGVQFTRRNMEAIPTTTTGFCSRSARSEAPFYPYRESYYLNQLATLEMMEAYDDAQRKGNSSSACGMEYYEFFPSDKTTSGEIIMEGGTFTKQESGEEEEGVEVEDYLMLEPSGSVGYYGGGGGEASCLTTSDHHHHEKKYYSSSSAYTYTLASNPTTTTTTTTSNSISSSLDLSLKLSS
ncbi:unnamed protein product [Linum trigynum]|uniref:Uncharacterized protein n=1 Tax=Linum trigynum TaxID=586398 RepID=A0AAV2C9R1_9ROSI